MSSPSASHNRPASDRSSGPFLPVPPGLFQPSRSRASTYSVRPCIIVTPVFDSTPNGQKTETTRVSFSARENRRTAAFES
jgi:hypothetical protein